jgi:hypothetical protein
MMMTQQRQLKALIRLRMDKTGEAYMVARRHVLNSRPGSKYVLRGGVHPESAACANTFANRGIDDPSTGEPIGEAMVVGIGGGLGAGYILWEFKDGDRRAVTTGFRNQWQYPDRWCAKTCERLGVRVEIHETTGPQKAADRLDRALDEGIPVIAFVSAGDLSYWHLPPDESGWWGYPIVVYAKEGDHYLVDDRNRGTLSISGEALAAARGRIPTYKHRLVIADPAATELDTDTFSTAVRQGIAEQIEHLSAASQSFSIPAFAKWAKMLTSTTNAKAWPRVFADGRGLLGALVSTYEGIDPIGILGGNLRGLYAEFLDRAGDVLQHDMSSAADAYRSAASAWDRVAEVCLDVPEVSAVVDADRARRAAVGRGDAGQGDAADAARRSKRTLQDESLALEPDAMATLFGRMAGALNEAVTAEKAALDTLRETAG